MDRKTFFEKAFKLVVGKGLSLIEDNALVRALEKTDEEKSAQEVRRQRPPGAAAEETFTQLCTGCDACMIACPVNVIMIDDWKKRLPLIYPDEAPCIHCQGYPCIQSCPTGALNVSYGTELRLINK